MRWLTNIQDPKWPGSNHMAEPGRSIEAARKTEAEYLKDKIIGDPKATDDYSMADLKRMNLVGVYVDDPEST